MAVLARGGNAFDAVVAGGFVLQVVEPHMCGPGGEVPAVFVTAGDPTPRVLCGQGVAPARATTALLRDELGLAAIPGTGLLPATVPGAWDGWLTLLRDHGTFPLADVLGPALAYAEDGFPLAPPVPTTIAAVEQHLREHWPSSAATWLPDGRVPTTTHRLPALAATWRRLLAEAVGPTREAQIDAARAAWYRGFVAEAIEEFVATPVRDATGRDHAGLLTADDLAGWSCSDEDAVVVEAGGGWAVAKPGPWSQGPVLAQTLQLLRDADLEYVDGLPSEAGVHRVAEAAKLAFADREAWYGDSHVADVPVKTLLSAGYADERRRLVGPEASAGLRPGAPDGRPPRLPDFVTRAFMGAGDDGSVSPVMDVEPPARLLDPGTGEPTMRTSGPAGPAASSHRAGDTCHLDVADRFGNMVSATPSGGWLQSSPVIPGLGFCLGTRAQMFTLTPGLPATLAPGQRPRTTLSPSLALRDREPYLAFGTPGGDQQDQWSLLFFLNHLTFGMNLQQAIDFPSFHSAHMPSSFYPRQAQPLALDVESRIGEPVIEDLRRRGHLVNVRPAWSLGRISAVARRDGILYAAANPRGMQGYAVGR